MRVLTRWDLGTKGLEVEGGDITAMNRLCWRGDSRSPKLIFNFGFRRRDDTAEGYFNRKAEWEDDHDDAPMPPSAALFRTQNRDIAPATAVCVAGSFQAAALFPLKGDAAEDATWVYAVSVENGFETYQMQARIGATKTLFVQEACSHDIPSMHVLGAIKLSRRWNGGTWEDGAFGTVIKDFRENPRSVGCVGRGAKLQQARNEIARTLMGRYVMIGP